MADRRVKVILEAQVAAYQRGMEQAASATDKASDSAERLSGSAGNLDDLGASAQNMAAGMDSAGASAASAAGGLSDAGAAAQDASAGMQDIGSAGQDASASLDSLGASNANAAASFSESSAALHRLSGGMAGISAEAQQAGSSLNGVGAQSQDVAAAMSQASGSARNAEAALVGVGAQSQSAASGMSAASAAAADVSGQMSSLNRGFLETAGNMEGDFNRVAGSLAVVGGGITAVNGYLAATGIQYNTLQQVSSRAMETMTGSASAAADQMERLHAFADESPFSRATWIEAQQQLMAFGMEGERVIPVMEGIQNSVAAIGGGDQEIMRLVDILGTVEGQGRMTGTELQRLGQMGINAAELIGSAMGVSGNEIRTQITAGALDAETAITALTDGMNTRFDGAAEGLRDTFTGAVDRIQARVRDLASVMMTPLVDPNGGGFLIDAMNMAADFGTQLLELPPVVLQVGGALSGLAGAGMLAGAGFLALAPQVSAAYDAFQRMRAALPALNVSMRTLAVTAGVAVAAVAGLAILNHMENQLRAGAMGAEELENSLRRAAEAGDVFNGQFAHLDGSDHIVGSMLRAREGVEDLNAAFELLSNGAAANVGPVLGGLQANIYDLTSGIPGLGAVTKFFAADMADAEEAIAQTDSALASMATGGNLDAAIDNMSAYADGLREQGHSADEIIGKFPELEAALYGYAESLGVSVTEAEMARWMLDGIAPSAVEAAEGIEGLAGGLSDVGNYAAAAEAGLSDTGTALTAIADSSSEAASALSEIVDAYTRLGVIQLDASEALMSYNEALWDLDAAIAENGNTMDRNTEAGIANQRAFRDVGKAAWDLAEANLQAGDSAESVAGGLQGTYDSLYETATAMGYTSDQAHEYAASFMQIPEHHRTDVEAFFEDFASDGIAALGVNLENIPEMKRVIIDVDGSSVPMNVELTQAEIDQIHDKTVGIYASDDGTVLEVQGAIDGITDGDAFVMVDDDGTVREVQAEIIGVQDGQATVRVDDGNSVNIVQWDIDSITDGSSTVHVTDSGIAGVEGRLNFLARTRTARINVVQSASSVAGGVWDRVRTQMATGGAVRGPGTGTSDDVPAMLSNGEHVLTAREVQLMGGQSGVYKFRSELTGGQSKMSTAVASARSMVPAYAAGGAVSHPGIDYDRLAATLGRNVVFNFHTNNAVAETPSATASKSLEAIGAGFLPSEVNHV